LTDIYLITGFLGAGKTTLMKNLLQVFNCGKTAVIVNEFGQEGVDGAVLEKEGMVIEEIVDGSIFCVCRSDKFIDTILKTEKLDVDYLIVESSGLADPFGMQEVMGIVNKLSPDKFHYSGSICVVDSKNFSRVCGLAPAAKQQVLGADLIFINKTDISNPAEIKEVEDILQSLNIHAEIVKTSFSKIPDVEQIHALQWRQPDMKGVLLKKTIGISKFTLKFDSIPVSQLTDWLKEWAGKTYRVKGFCDQYYIQAVQDDVNVSEFQDEKKENFLVVLAPANDALKEEIINSWNNKFTRPIQISS
jgi:G3E family GTPase